MPVSTEVPIYLVSACTTGEEFVAAFRRYADRSGLFIPIAEPIPVGKRGRFAVTLRDGGVMVDGIGEVVSSTRTPSVLHGRIGMTVRFVEPDEASKTVLVELEKARLSMKPPPPSVPPRAANVPAAPRPVPPPASGRIDATNALAECVAIGDLDGLEDSAPKPVGPRFVVPSVAPVPEAQRARSPSGPHSLAMRPRSPSGPVVAPASIRPKSPTTPPLGMPSPPRTPGGPAGMRPKSPSVSSTQPTAVVPPPMPAPAPLPPRLGLPRSERPPEKPRNPTMALPTLLRMPADSRDTVAQAVPLLGADAGDDDTIAGIESSAPYAAPPPSPPSVPPGAAATYADSIPVSNIEIDEPTDLTELPLDAPGRMPAPTPGGSPVVNAGRVVAFAATTEGTDRVERVPRRTVLGIAVVPDGMTVLPASSSSGPIAMADTSVIASQPPTVEEPTPSGDWTIIPGADKPTLEPRTAPGESPSDAAAMEATVPAAPLVAVSVESSAPITAAAPGSAGKPGKAPPGPLTGDWSMSIQPDSPDGCSEPSKIEQRAGTKPGPPMSVVASTKLLDSAPKSQPVDAVGGPKVEIDPTLMEPLRELPPLPPEDLAADSAFGGYPRPQTGPVW